MTDLGWNVALHAGYNRQNPTQFSTHNWLVILYSVDKALLRGFPWAFLPRHKGRQRREDNVGNDLFCPWYGLCAFLSKLVGLVLTHFCSRCSITLHLLCVLRLYLPIDGWSVDESFAQKQPDGWRFQYGKWEFYARNTADAKRVFGELAYTLLLQKEMEQRVDQHRQSFPCFNGTRHTGFG